MIYSDRGTARPDYGISDAKTAQAVKSLRFLCKKGWKRTKSGHGENQGEDAVCENAS